MGAVNQLIARGPHLAGLNLSGPKFQNVVFRNSMVKSKHPETIRSVIQPDLGAHIPWIPGGDLPK